MRAMVSILAMGLGLCGRATIHRGVEQPVFFDSIPPGAEIEYREQIHITPCLISLEKNDAPLKLTVYKHGFAPAEVTCTTHNTIWMLWSILQICPIHIGIDAAYRSWAELDTLTQPRSAHGSERGRRPEARRRAGRGAPAAAGGQGARRAKEAHRGELDSAPGRRVGVRQRSVKRSSPRS